MIITTQIITFEWSEQEMIQKLAFQSETMTMKFVSQRSTKNEN